MMKFKQLPKYFLIEPKDLPKASVLLETHNSRFTMWGENYIRKFPYKPAFSHANLYMKNDMILNVGSHKYIDSLKRRMTKNRNIYALILRTLTTKQRKKAIGIATREAGSKKEKLLPTYDWKGYFAFIPWLNKIIRPSHKRDYCSDNVVDILQEVDYDPMGNLDSEKTSPCDLFLWALDNAEYVEIRALRYRT